MSDKNVDDLEIESPETCPNCGSFVGEETTCGNCGAMLGDDDDLDIFEDDSGDLN